MNKIFKKYWYCLLANLFLLFKQYNEALQYFSCVSRYDFFLLNSSDAATSAGAYSTSKKPFVVRGGVGDILQSVPFMLKNRDRDYLVLTHFKGAEVFFEQINLPIKKFYFYTNSTEYKKEADFVYRSNENLICPRSLYFQNNPFSSEFIFFDNRNPILGVHLGASDIEANKALPFEFLKKIVSSTSLRVCNFLVFCQKSDVDDLQRIDFFETDKIKFVSNTDITMSLGLVAACDLFVGSDSAFKTMASMLKIPTIVVFQNTKNGFRDRTFINPYVAEGVIKSHKFIQMNELVIESVVASIKAELDKLVIC